MPKITIENLPKLNVGDVFYEVYGTNMTESIIENITFHIAECEAGSDLMKKLGREPGPITKDWSANTERFYIKYFYWTSFSGGRSETDFWEFSKEFKYEISSRNLFLKKEDAEKQLKENVLQLINDNIKNIKDLTARNLDLTNQWNQLVTF